MAILQLLACVALALATAQGVSFFPAGYPQILSLPKGYIKEPLTLTCAVNFTDKYKPTAGIVNAIAVTIREKQGFYGAMSPSMFSYGGGAPSGGLSATINIFSLIGGPVSVAFTEKARPERGCYADDFGSFLTGPPVTPAYGLGQPSYGAGLNYGGGSPGGLYGLGGIGNNAGLFGLGGINPGNNYGMGQGYAPNGYGMGPGQGYGMGAGQGFGMGPGQGFGMGANGPMGGAGYQGGLIFTDQVPGVVANIRLTPGTASEISIDTLAGFSSLKDLAGRGVVVCPDGAVENKYGDAVCDSGILSCCALHYDYGEQRLSVSY